MAAAYALASLREARAGGVVKEVTRVDQSGNVATAEGAVTPPQPSLLAEMGDVLHQLPMLPKAIRGFARLPPSEQLLRRNWLARTLRTLFASHGELCALADCLEAEDDDLGMTWEERFEPSHAWILAHEVPDDVLAALKVPREDWHELVEGRAPVATLVLAGSLAIASGPDDLLQMYTDALLEVRVGAGHLTFACHTGVDNIRKRLEELVSTASSISPPDDAASMASKLHHLTDRTVVPSEWRGIADRLLTQMSVSPDKRAALRTRQELFRADPFVLTGQRAAEVILHGQPQAPPKVHVLLIEGGGVRGVVPLATLRELERLLGAYESAHQSIYHSFDLVGGTSVGGVLAALVFGLGLPLSDVEDYFKELVRRVFCGNAASAKTRHTEARKLATKFVSKAMERWRDPTVDLSKMPSCDVVLVAQQKLEDAPDTLAPFVFYTGGLDDDLVREFFGTRAMRLQRPTPEILNDDELVESWITAVLATSAAPWLFDPVKVTLGKDQSVLLVDGVIGASCPAMVVWPLVRSMLSAERRLESVTCLGTGKASDGSRTTMSFKPKANDSKQLKATLGLVWGTTSGKPPWMAFCSEVRCSHYRGLVVDKPLLVRVDPVFETRFKIDLTDQSTLSYVADLAKRHAALHMPTLVRRLVPSLPVPTMTPSLQEKMELTHEEEAYLWQPAHEDGVVHLLPSPEAALAAGQSCGRFTTSQLHLMLELARRAHKVRMDGLSQSFDLCRPDEDVSSSGTPLVTVTFVFEHDNQAMYDARRDRMARLEEVKPLLHDQAYRFQRLLAIGDHTPSEAVKDEEVLEDLSDNDPEEEIEARAAHRFFVTVTAGRRTHTKTLEELLDPDKLSVADRALILVDTWRALYGLKRAGLVHRALNLRSVLLDSLDHDPEAQSSSDAPLHRKYAVQLGDMHLAKPEGSLLCSLEPEDTACTLLAPEEQLGWSDHSRNDTETSVTMVGRFGRLVVTVLRGKPLTKAEVVASKCPLGVNDSPHSSGSDEMSDAEARDPVETAVHLLSKLAVSCWRKPTERPSVCEVNEKVFNAAIHLEGTHCDDGADEQPGLSGPTLQSLFRQLVEYASMADSKEVAPVGETKPVGKQIPYMARKQSRSLNVTEKKDSMQLVTSLEGREANLRNWTPDMVREWLHSESGAAPLIPMFEELQLDGKALCALTEAKLFEYNIKSIAAEMALRAIRSLQASATKLDVVSHSFGVIAGTVPKLDVPVIKFEQFAMSSEDMVLIGEGSYGAVYRCIFRDDNNAERDVVIKTPKEPQSRNEQQLARVRAAELTEILCLAKLKIVAEESNTTCTNVVELIGVCDDVPNAAGPCPVLAYHENGDLRAYLRTKRNELLVKWRKDPRSLMQLLKGIVAGVAFMHSCELVHGDLKLDNVVVTSAHEPRISDMGKARSVRGSWPEWTPLQLRRMPPEFLLSREFDERGDVWMLGLLLADVLRMHERIPLESNPTEDGGMTNLYEEAQNALTVYDVADVGVPEAVKGLLRPGSEEYEVLVEVISGCLKLDAAERYPSATHVLHAFEAGGF